MNELIKTLLKSNLIALLKKEDIFDGILYSGYIILIENKDSIEVEEFINKSTGVKKRVLYNDSIKVEEFNSIYIEILVDNNKIIIDKKYNKILESSSEIINIIDNEEYTFQYNSYVLEEVINITFNNSKIEELLEFDSLIREFEELYVLKSKIVIDSKLELLINKYK
jgi:hypothetical protein